MRRHLTLRWSISSGLIAALLALGAGRARAGGAERWQITGREAFLAGELEGAAVSGEGVVVLAPAKQEWSSLDATSIWALVGGPDGSLFAGTGNDGKVFRVSRDRSELYFDAAELEVHALALGPDGALYAGTSPDGKVYRLSSAQQASVFFDPEDTYIWALRFGADGALFVGTGPEGKLYQVDRAGHGTLFYDSDDEHVRALGFDREGRLLAGTSGWGWVIRFEAGRPFVLMDADQPEVTGLALGADGSIYASLIGKAEVKKGPAKKSAPPAAVFTETVVAAVDTGEPSGSTPEASAAGTSAAATAAATAQGGALIRIHPDGFGESVWSDESSAAYAVGTFADQAVIGTGDKGRLLGIDDRGRSGALFDAGARQLSSLLMLPSGALAVGASSPAKVFVLGPQEASRGSYLSKVQDAGTFARWGAVRLRARGSVSLQSRSGNTAEPGDGWSPWSAAGTEVTSPAARFLQFRLDLAGERPAAEEVVISYQPHNLPPVVEAIELLPPHQALEKQQIVTGGATFAIGSEIGSEPNQRSRSREKGFVQQVVQVGKRALRWQASDPNGDDLVYAVYFRGGGEQNWKLLEDQLEDEFLTFDARALPDGYYQFRVVAEDSRDNTPQRAKSGDAITPAALIDNAPPLVTVEAPDGAPSGELTARASDAVSALRSAAYSIDAGPWIALLPQDGVMDEREESFRFTLAALSGGEHLIVLRIEDDAANVGTGRLVIQR